MKWKRALYKADGIYTALNLTIDHICAFVFAQVEIASRITSRAAGRAVRRIRQGKHPVRQTYVFAIEREQRDAVQPCKVHHLGGWQVYEAERGK